MTTALITDTVGRKWAHGLKSHNSSGGRHSGQKVGVRASSPAVAEELRGAGWIRGGGGERAQQGKQIPLRGEVFKNIFTRLEGE